MDTEPSLIVEVLGPMSVRRGEQPVSLRSPLQRKVLAALVVAHRSVLADELIDVLWGERPPATAVGTLQTHVSRLRTALGGGGAVASDASGYRLELEPSAVDAWQFEHLLDEIADASAAGRVDDAQALSVTALGLWRGPALSDFRYEPFAQTEIARLEGLRLTALERRIAWELDSGRHHDACTELESLVQDHPLREELHGQLMVALYRCGRQADALAVYERLRVTLLEDLGLEPTPQLRRLHVDILNHAPALAASQEPASGLAPRAQGIPRATDMQGWLERIEVPALDDKLSCELLLARGDGQRRSGREEQARRSYAAAIRLAAATGSADQLAAGALGLAGPPEDTILGEPLDESLMEQAIRALPENRTAVTMLRARLAVALIDRGDLDRGNQMADAAVVAARSTGDAAALAYALRARHRTWFDPAALDERLALDGELIDLGLQAGDDEVSAWGHRWRSIDLLEQGELAAFEHELDLLEALASRLHDAFHWWGVVIRRAGLALLTGPPDKAEPLIMESLGLAGQIGSPYTTASSLIALWALRWQQGRLDEIEDAVLDVEMLSPSHVFLVPYLHRELDQPELAARTYAHLAEDGFADLFSRDTVGATRLLGLVVLSDVAAYLRITEHAAELRGALLPFAGQLAVIHPGLSVVAPVDQALGQLSGLLGDRRRSETHFEAAIATCKKMGARTLTARAEVAYAETLSAFGDDHAAGRREQLLADAADLAAELGTRALERRLARS